MPVLQRSTARTLHPDRSLLVAVLTLVLSGLAAIGRTDDRPAALTVDGRLVPVAPDVIARNRAGVAVRATRIATPLTIDGVLDEEVYAHVQSITEFEQQDPHEGAPVSERTEAW